MNLQPDDVAGIAVTLLAGSELLSLLPNVKANGWVQLLLAALRGIASTEEPKRPDRRRWRR